MIRRKKHLDFYRIRYLNWEKQKENFVEVSFRKNFWCDSLLRLSFIFKPRYYNRQHMFYNSQNKLQCPYFYSFSVPNKKLQASRFFLNKGVEKLMYGGFQK